MHQDSGLSRGVATFATKRPEKLVLRNSILLPIFDDEKEKRYAERDSGRDEKDQGSGVASEGFFQR